MIRKSRDKSKKEDEGKALRMEADFFHHLGGKFFLSEGKKLTEKSLEEATRLMMSDKTRKHVILKCDGALCHEVNFRGRCTATLTLDRGIEFIKKFGRIVKKGREEESGRRDSTQLKLFKAKFDGEEYYFVITKMKDGKPTTIKTLRDTLLAQEYEREDYDEQPPRVRALLKLNKKSRPDLSCMTMGQQIMNNVLINLGRVPPTSPPKASTVSRTTPILSEETKEESKTMVANRASTGAIQARDAPSDLDHAVAPPTVDSHSSRQYEGVTKFDDVPCRRSAVSLRRVEVSRRRLSEHTGAKTHVSQGNASAVGVTSSSKTLTVSSATTSSITMVSRYKTTDEFNPNAKYTKQESTSAVGLTSSPNVLVVSTTTALPSEETKEETKAKSATRTSTSTSQAHSDLDHSVAEEGAEAASLLLTSNSRPPLVVGPDLVKTTPDRPISPTKRPHADQGSFQDDERQWKKFRPGKGCCIC